MTYKNDGARQWPICHEDDDGQSLADRIEIMEEMVQAGCEVIRRLGLLAWNTDPWVVAELAQDTFRAMMHQRRR